MKTSSDLAQEVRAAIDVDWYGPNPDYRAVVDAGVAALAELQLRLGVAAVALGRIADADYRGNEPQERRIAREALLKMRGEG